MLRDPHHSPAACLTAKSAKKCGSPTAPPRHSSTSVRTATGSAGASATASSTDGPRPALAPAPVSVPAAPLERQRCGVCGFGGEGMSSGPLVGKSPTLSAFSPTPKSIAALAVWPPLPLLPPRRRLPAEEVPGAFFSPLPRSALPSRPLALDPEPPPPLDARSALPDSPSKGYSSSARLARGTAAQTTLRSEAALAADRVHASVMTSPPTSAAWMAVGPIAPALCAHRSTLSTKATTSTHNPQRDSLSPFSESAG